LAGPADRLLLLEAGELERAPPAGDDAALLVGREERRVGRRVVVVEQLEQEAEAAVRAAAGLAAEPGVALGLGRAAGALRADEQVGHAFGGECSAAAVNAG
jgi:hypothetical protein